MKARYFFFALVFTLVLAVIGGIHWLFYRRLVVASGLGGLGFGVALATLLTLMVAQPFLERVQPTGRLLRSVSLVSYTWMGAAFYLLLGVLVTDLMLLFLSFGGPSAFRVRALIVLATTAVVTAVALREGLRAPRLREVSIGLKNWPEAFDGLRVVQLSDIHIGPILGAPFASALVARVADLNPDLIIVTGDLVDGSVRRLTDDIAPFAGLSAPHGVWFVTGNHDVYSNGASWVAHAKTLGWRVLRNQHALIEDPATGGAFALAGVNDHDGARIDPIEAENLDAALAGVPSNVPTVLLAHDPRTFIAASERAVDLQISGHTHGGQLWPFNLLVGLAMPHVQGLESRGAAQIYVSRGTGFWGPPMRLRARSELTLLTLLRSP